MSSAPRIAAIVPAYQAAQTVGGVVAGTRRVVQRVLVVDDGSTDDTASAARAAGAEVVAHEYNRGKGAALRTGMDHLFSGEVDFVVTLDADGQHLPAQITRLTATLDGSPDLVLGSRRHLFHEMGAVRRFSNSLSSHAISFAAGTSLSDIQTGFRLYSERLHDAVGIREAGFEAESAVVVRACRAGLRVVETEVEMGVIDGRGTSHYRPLIDSGRIAIAVTRARVDWNSRR